MKAVIIFRFSILLCLCMSSLTFAQNAPSLESLGGQDVQLGEEFELMIRATDADGDSLSFRSVLTLPEGAILEALDDTTAVLSWTPGQDQIGSHVFIVSVSDPTGLSDSEHFMIWVQREGPVPPSPPILSPIEDITIKEGNTFVFQLEATDPNKGEVLTFDSPKLPDDATLDPETGMFSWIPEHGQIGPHLITFTVTDGTGLRDSTNVTITVIEIPRPPDLSPIADMTINEGERFVFILEATDPNEDEVLLYSCSNLPEGATLDETKGIFRWIPTQEQVGPHILYFKIFDPTGLSDSDTVGITVNDVQHPPYLLPIGDMTATIGEELTFVIQGRDSDGDSLFYTMHDPPPGARLNIRTGEFTWLACDIPEEGIRVEFRVTDITGLFDSDTISIRVHTVPHPPDLPKPIEDMEIGEGEEVRFTLHATDPDGGELRYSVTTKLPPGATFNDTNWRILLET
jgi:hypothetical protein